MAALVMKYGGSSLSSVQQIQQVAQIISRKKEAYDNIVVVVSAMGKTTNGLIDMAQAITKTPNKREMDVLLSTGEQISISLLAIALNALNHKSISLTGWQAGIKTYGSAMKQKIKDIDLSRITKEHENGNIVIVAGFQGYDEKEDISTLGRGGSDTSAVALAAALACPCEIYTDVAGIYSVDPKIYPKAKIIPHLSYEEMMEMASLGAKILEPRSVDLAARFKVPLTITLNTGEVEGTKITQGGNMLEEQMITNVSVLDDVVLFNIEHFADEPQKVLALFNACAQAGVNIDVISQNFNQDISFTTNKNDLLDVVAIVKEITHHPFDYKDDVVKVSVIGNAMRYHSGVAAQVYTVFAQEEIQFYQVSTSEISISYIIDAKNKEKTVLALAEQFQLKGEKHA
ncbi:MAG TPA: aspartate kinase [Erysipelothrix sp.]